MEVLNDVLAQARLSRIGRGGPQKMKGCLGGRCTLRAASRHPLNSCTAEELSASAVNRPSVRRPQPGRPKCRLAELQRLSNDGFLVVSPAAAKHDTCREEHGHDDGALQTLHGLLSFG